MHDLTFNMEEVHFFNSMDIQNWLMWMAVPGILVVVFLFYLVRSQSSLRKDSSVTNSQVKNSDQPEVIIVGSGILGSALAATLARNGRRVTVIEKDMKEPDRIVGELLQPGGYEALRILGLEDCTTGIDAHQIKGYVVHDICKGTDVHIPYPSVSSDQKGGCAFHHGRFVMALRKAAMAEPNVRFVEATVTRLLEDSDGTVVGVQYREKDSDTLLEMRAALTVVADGCFSRLRKSLVKSTPEVKSHFVGLLMEDCPQMRPNHAELVLANPSPILVYQISSSHTRVLVDVRQKLPRDIREHLTENVAPQLPGHLRDPFLQAVDSGKIRSMPNNFMAAAPLMRRGAICLGDALNMRHPLTGGGMTVAFRDIVIWSGLLREIPDLTDYGAVEQAARKFYTRRKSHHSFVVNVLSMALYELFAATNDSLNSLKAACFEYFQLGGRCVSGPVALLSVLNPKPSLLIGHFFAVVVYAMYFALKRRSLLYLPLSIYQAACILLSGCNILFPLIWSEMKTLILY